MNNVMKKLLIASLVCISVCIIGIAAVYFLKIKQDDAQPMESFEQELSTKINSIDIDISNGTIELVKGDSFNLEVENSLKDKFKCEVSDGILTIRQKNEVEIKLFGWSIGTNFRIGGLKKFKLKLTVPEDTDFSKLNINVGAGTIIMKDITGDVMLVQAGAGKISLESCAVKNSSAFQVGAGSFKAEDVELGNSTVECGTGIVNIKLKDSSEKDNIKLISSICWKNIE